MSILPATLQEASSLFKNRVTVEWPAYTRACEEIAQKKTEPVDAVLRRKRSQAVKYLCNNRPSKGSPYSLTEPRIFTIQFISELGAANSKMRAKRNPWVEGMLQEMRDKSVWPLPSDKKSIKAFGPHVTAQEPNSMSESVKSSA